MKIAHESKVRATHEPSPPMNVHVLDLIYAVEDAAGYADGRRIADLIRQPAERFGKRYLDGVDRALRIRAVHQKVSDLVGLSPVWQRRHAPCPDCGLPTLGQWVGTDIVRCSSEDCQGSLTLTEYEKYCIEKSKNA